MKRRVFNKRVLLGSLGLGVLPVLARAGSNTAQFQRFAIPACIEHIRHGAFDLFRSGQLDLGSSGLLAVERHLFYANGYGPGPEDKLFVHVLYQRSEGAKRVLLDLGSDALQNREVYNDGLLVAQIVGQGTGLKLGDVLVPIEKNGPIKKGRIPTDQLLLVSRAGSADIGSSSDKVLLLRLVHERN